MSAAIVSAEAIISELLDHYRIDSPPVPIERILQTPARGMWDEVDLSRFQLPPANDGDPFALRMALAVLLARMLCASPWGAQRGLNAQCDDEALARTLLMPRELLIGLPAVALTPPRVQRMFQSPLPQARRRLIELDVLIP
jgi:hypothetical protein